MKKIFISLFIALISLFSFSAFAQEGSRWKYWSDPLTILDTVVWEANSSSRIQDTALDNISDTEGSFQSNYKISNTLDYLRINMAPYIQWAVYIGLVMAVILLIYNGFLMVTNTIHKTWDFQKIKTRIWYIVIWVLLLTGFYAIIKLVVWLINSIFGSWPSGATGF